MKMYNIDKVTYVKQVQRQGDIKKKTKTGGQLKQKQRKGDI